MYYYLIAAMGDSTRFAVYSCGEELWLSGRIKGLHDNDDAGVVEPLPALPAQPLAIENHAFVSAPPPPPPPRVALGILLPQNCPGWSGVPTPPPPPARAPLTTMVRLPSADEIQRMPESMPVKKRKVVFKKKHARTTTTEQAAPVDNASATGSKTDA